MCTFLFLVRSHMGQVSCGICEILLLPDLAGANELTVFQYSLIYSTYLTMCAMFQVVSLFLGPSMRTPSLVTMEIRYCKEEHGIIASNYSRYKIRKVLQITHKVSPCLNKLWNCSQVNATEYLWWVYTGSGSGLVPSGTKPLPEPMLAQIYVAMWRH